MVQDERATEIAEALEGLLEDGDEWVVSCDEDEIDVRAADEIDEGLDETHPELYGHLLEVSKELSNAGINFVWVGVLAMGGVCLAIHMNWIDGLFGIKAEWLQGFWVYLFLLVAAFMVMGYLATQVESLVYARRRKELGESFRRSGMTRWHLLARIEDDPGVEEVAERLKTDRGIVDTKMFR